MSNVPDENFDILKQGNDMFQDIKTRYQNVRYTKRDIPELTKAYDIMKTANEDMKVAYKKAQGDAEALRAQLVEAQSKLASQNIEGDPAQLRKMISDQKEKLTSQVETLNKTNTLVKEMNKELESTKQELSSCIADEEQIIKKLQLEEKLGVPEDPNGYTPNDSDDDDSDDDEFEEAPTTIGSQVYNGAAAVGNALTFGLFKNAPETEKPKEKTKTEKSKTVNFDTPAERTEVKMEPSTGVNPNILSEKLNNLNVSTPTSDLNKLSRSELVQAARDVGITNPTGRSSDILEQVQIRQRDRGLNSGVLTPKTIQNLTTKQIMEMFPDRKMTRGVNVNTLRDELLELWNLQDFRNQVRQKDPAFLAEIDRLDPVEIKFLLKSRVSPARFRSLKTKESQLREIYELKIKNRFDLDF